MTDRRPVGAPDGGWGWVIVVAAFVNYVLIGFGFSAFGVMYLALIEYFQSESGFIGGILSLYAFTGNFLGILVGALVRKYDTKRICLVGCLMASVANMLSSFLFSIPYLYFAYGLIGGVGSGAIFLSTNVTVMKYFDKKRSAAVGLSMSGLSVGSMLSPPLVNLLLQVYGLSGCYLLISAIWLHALAATCLFRPLSSTERCNEANGHQQQQVEILQKAPDDTNLHSADDFYTTTENTSLPNESEADALNESAEETTQTQDIEKQINRISLRDVQEEKSSLVMLHMMSEESTLHSSSDTSAEHGASTKSSQHSSFSPGKVCTDILELSLLKDKAFPLFLISTFTTSLEITSFVVHFISRSIHVGLERRLAIIIQIVMGACTLFGQYIFGVIANWLHVSHVISYGVLIVAISTVVLTFPLAKTFTSLLTIGIIHGILAGIMFCVQQVAVVEIAGIQRVEKAVGYLHMLLATGSLIGVPMTGRIYDALDNYDIPFYVVGAIELMGSSLVFAAAFITRRRRRR